MTTMTQTNDMQLVDLSQKRFKVQIQAHDAELVDILYGIGATDGVLEYETNHLGNKAALYADLYELLNPDGEETVTQEEIGALVEEIVFSRDSADEVQISGSVFYDNDYWTLRAIDTKFNFDAEWLAGTLAESDDITKYDITIDAVKIADIPLNDYKRVFGVKDWENSTTSDIAALLARYKADLTARDSERSTAVNWVQSMIKDGKIDALFDSATYLNKDISLTGQNIVFIDDATGELNLPDAYQINTPSTLLGGEIGIYQGNTLNEFDALNHKTISEFDEYILAVGKLVPNYIIDDAHTETKSAARGLVASRRLFVMMNSPKNKVAVGL